MWNCVGLIIVTQMLIWIEYRDKTTFFFVLHLLQDSMSIFKDKVKENSNKIMD